MNDQAGRTVFESTPRLELLGFANDKRIGDAVANASIRGVNIFEKR